MIDEYDTPIHVAFTAGYYDQEIEFFRIFLGSALKDNSDLLKGVLTGILRISKESYINDRAAHSVHWRHSTRQVNHRL